MLTNLEGILSSVQSNELRAIRNIGTIHLAQEQYRLKYGKYAISLSELGPPITSVGPESADLIDRELVVGGKNGYRFTLSGGAGSGYEINAEPVTFGATGSRSFYSDQTL